MPPRAPGLRALPAVLLALCLALCLALVGCGSTGPGEPEGDAGSPTPAPVADPAAQLEALEQRTGATVGVHVVDTATGETVSHRAEERFALASTVKALAAGAVLARLDDAALDQRVRFGEADLVDYSPVAETAVDTGLTVREVISAAVSESDNTAGNLLLDQLGGPAGLQADLRRLGDDTTRTDRREPDLNDWTPGDDRDTTTPQALAASFRAYALDDALAPADRQVLVDALLATTTGDATVRAGLPDGWTSGGKTGSASYGTRNDVAFARPPGGGAPVVVVVMTHVEDPDAETDDAVVAEATRIALGAL